VAGLLAEGAQPRQLRETSRSITRAGCDSAHTRRGIIQLAIAGSSALTPISRSPGERASAQLIPEGAGRVRRWCVRVRDDFRVGHGHTKAARGGAMPEGPGPGGAPVFLAAAGLGERPGWVKDRAGPAGGAGAGGVLDAGRVRAGDRAPRGEQGLCGWAGLRGPSAVRVLAGGLAALIPSGRPAAPGRGAWGWSARAAGSIKRRPRRQVAGAKLSGDHALPASRPAHAACCGVRAARHRACPSRIA
jgi:hypothetical protein